MASKIIELLAPAKDFDCGVAAVEHGADAVYIGAPRFSARAAAGNSLEDIGKLIQFAHQFHARVYIALNTILTDEEIEEAVKMIHRLYELGADALIIQDMGLLGCDLPPIPLHASTQMNNRTVKKVSFLEKIGFQQVVLARELSLTEIEEIARHTSVNLECFVHGSLCVSYSGQCYISEVMAGRSANRGECAQFCRHSFSLKDAAGETIIQNKHLLSLKDLNYSEELPALIDAGVRSFKIEGRLKDINYVKNITALYRQKLDTIIDADSSLRRASSGRCTFSFQPDAYKSFNRGYSQYFLDGKKKRPGSIDTPKSLGKQVGKVRNVAANYIEVETNQPFTNGDGLCYFDHQEQLVGFRVNRADGCKVYPQKMVRPRNGTVLYRNHDVMFNKGVSASSDCRKIDVSIVITENDEGLAFQVIDEDGVESMCTIAVEKIPAKKPDITIGSIKKQTEKCGNTILNVIGVDVLVDPQYYYSAAQLNELRRRGGEHHIKKRTELHKLSRSKIVPNSEPWVGGPLSYLDNISNTKAEAFYKSHGAISASRQVVPSQLMNCKYCIKAQLDLCPELGDNKEKFREPLILSDRNGEYRLLFNCSSCEMKITKMK